MSSKKEEYWAAHFWHQKADALAKALEFYANPAVYAPHPHGSAFDRRDISYRAKNALEEYRKGAVRDDGPPLTPAEQKAQGERCGCMGADDYCPCQNVPDLTTRAQRDYADELPPNYAVCCQSTRLDTCDCVNKKHIRVLFSRGGKRLYQPIGDPL